MIPPAARSRATAVASALGTKFARPLVPPVQMTPVVSSVSLMVMGTPCSEPLISPRASAASASSASFRAESAVNWTMALSFGLTLAICSRCASTIALELSFLDRIAPASSLADFAVMSPLTSEAASAEPISDVRPAVATAPAIAIVPRKSRRPILLSICNPISQAYAANSQSRFSSQCKERASLLVDHTE